MFDRDRQMCAFPRIVAAQAQELTAEQKQRDIFEAHRHRVFSVGYYMTSNEVEAESILTRTFVEAFAETAEPDSRRIDQSLLEELEKRFQLAPAEPANPDANASLSRGHVRKTDMEEAVAELPPRERLIFLLHDVESYKPPKIAELLRCEPLEVQTTLISARIRMRNAIHRLRQRDRFASEQILQDIATCA